MLDLDAIFDPDRPASPTTSRQQDIRSCQPVGNGIPDNAVPPLTGNGSPAPSADFLPPLITPDDLPADWHFLWDERAAIMEYDGKMPRERAEAFALVDVLRQMKLAGEIP